MRLGWAGLGHPSIQYLVVLSLRKSEDVELFISEDLSKCLLEDHVMLRWMSFMAWSIRER